ncbi:MAG: hypothetical protein AAGJ32_03720 [Pseudomonadota bacterium]
MTADARPSVFINCPFSDDYTPFFRAIVFAVADCGFQPRCALEDIDSGEIRLDKIMRIIQDCRYGIHDLSNMALDPNSHLPRFNMPLELGLFLGAKRYGDALQKQKRLIVMDREAFRYREAISDISGQDVECHQGDPLKAIKRVRDWLRTVSRRKTLPGGTTITERYEQYECDFPEICSVLSLDGNDLPFQDLLETIAAWQSLNEQV